LVGERRRTDYTIDVKNRVASESFEIKIRNHKTEPVAVRVVEHLYRAVNWNIESSSTEYKKTESHTIEFPVNIAPDTEKTITYVAHYSW